MGEETTAGAMSVSELARRGEVTAEAVRYYTRRGLLKPSRDPRNGYRRYAQRDLRRLQFIHRAKALGYTLAEIERIFGYAEAGRSPCPEVRLLLRHRLDETRSRLEGLNALQRRMERAWRQWEGMPDRLPDGNSICHLIESAD